MVAAIARKSLLVTLLFVGACASNDGMEGRDAGVAPRDGGGLRDAGRVDSASMDAPVSDAIVPPTDSTTGVDSGSSDGGPTYSCSIDEMCPPDWRCCFASRRCYDPVSASCDWDSGTDAGTGVFCGFRYCAFGEACCAATSTCYPPTCTTCCSVTMMCPRCTGRSVCCGATGSCYDPRCLACCPTTR